jgi:hypothetical protein
MTSDFLPLLVAGGVIALVVTIFIRISMRLRRGGGSLTTAVLGATDEFLNRDKSKAAETIVDRNAGKTRNPESTSSANPNATARTE